MRAGILYLFLFLQISCIYSQVWKGVGGGVTGGGFVRTLAVANNNLYVGGAFESAGSITAYRIALWNGTLWDSLGGGVDNGIPYTITSDSANIFVGGSFHNAGGLNVAKLAKWDGNSWSGLSFNIDFTSPVYAIKYKDNLYAGGKFYTVNGTTVNHITYWNDTQWKAVAGGVDGGVNPEVRCMAVYKGELYVGGDFAVAGNVQGCWNIARWNGIKWDSLGSGLNYLPNVMLTDTVNNLLYVGGGFTKAGNIVVNNLAKWDGTTWSDVGGGIISKLGGVSSLAMYRGNLFVGSYDATGTFIDTILTRWDGTNWYRIHGPNSTIASLYVYNDELYVGGDFDKVDTVGGVLTVNYIARYWMPPVGVEEVKAAGGSGSGQLIIYPNPAGGSFTVEVESWKMEEGSWKLEMYDVKGKLVKEMEVGSGKMEVNTKGWGKGVYFVNLVADGKVVGKEKVIVE